jgi:hypothetical protein
LTLINKLAVANRSKKGTIFSKTSGGTLINAKAPSIEVAIEIQFIGHTREPTL